MITCWDGKTCVLTNIQGFYINLPVGAAFAPAYFLLFPSVDPHPSKNLSQKFRLVDWVNAIIFLAGSVCLAVVLTFGGVVYAFNSGTVIALWTVTGVLLVAFIVMLKLHPLVTKQNRLYPLHFFEKPTLINMQLQVFLASGIILVGYLRWACILGMMLTCLRL